MGSSSGCNATTPPLFSSNVLAYDSDEAQLPVRHAVTYVEMSIGLILLISKCLG